MSIMIATVADVAALEKLVNSAYRGESSKKGWTTEADLLAGIRINQDSLEELLNNPRSIIFLYKQLDKIVGCVNLLEEEQKLYLGMLTVSPERQNHGIGKKLLEHAEYYAKNTGISTIEMTVISQRNELIDWYERHGYQKSGEKRPFPMNDPRFGEPKTLLEFEVLYKNINQE